MRKITFSLKRTTDCGAESQQLRALFSLPLFFYFLSPFFGLKPLLSST